MSESPMLQVHSLIDMVKIQGQNPTPQGESEFIDGSDPLFLRYLKLAGDEDEKMTNDWKEDATGILIFTGLFSAAVAVLVAVSVQDLKPNSPDISALYLANIYQILADSNGSQVIPPPLPNPSIPFSPPTSAVWVNSLWFLSLLISLTCALLATLLQQWARRYMRVTRTRYTPYKRARIRAFFSDGVGILRLPLAVELLPTLLHLSLFLFFAGLAVFLFNINHTVFKVAISWIGVCTSIYMCITFLPTFRHDSPYYAPLSSSAWYLYTGILLTLSRILLWIADRFNVYSSIRKRARDSKVACSERISRGIDKEFEETALNAPSEIVGHALVWTFESLDEDKELEQFFAEIPGFCTSKMVHDPQSDLERLRSRMGEALKGFLERTWSYDLVPDTTKIQRLVICVRAIDAARLSVAADDVFCGFLLPHRAILQSVELGHSLISWGNNDNRNTSLFAQGIISCIIANALHSNDGPDARERWHELTMHHLGISRDVLRGYLDYGNSLLFANLINFTRQIVHNFLEVKWDMLALSCIFSGLGSNYDVRDTLPGLQLEFCGLWNEIVLQTRDIDHRIAFHILKAIHPVYFALHGRSDTEYSPYQLCTIPTHHTLGSASNLYEVDGTTAETRHASITTSPDLHRHNTVPSVSPLVTEHDAPPSPTSNLDHPNPHTVVEESRNGALNNFTPVASSSLLDNNRRSPGTAVDPIQPTTDPSTISSVVNTSFRSTSSHDTASQPTRNMTTSTPSFVPDTVPPSITLLAAGPDAAAPQISDNPTMNQSDRPPDDG